MNLSENSKVMEASMAGGLSPDEAEELAYLGPKTLESGDYSFRDLPALGVYIKDYEGEDFSPPEEDLESYIDQLLDDPRRIVPEWDLNDFDFEKLNSHVKAKRDEYTLRTIYAVEESLDQDFIDESVREIVEQPNYKNNASTNWDGGNLSLILGQYLSEIEEMVEDEDTMMETYRKVAKDPESSAAAAANVNVDELPEEIQSNLYLGGEELSSDRIKTRLRSMKGAGKCNKLDEKHYNVLLAIEPSRNTTLLTLEDEPVGSLKYDGDESMLALKDLTFNGRQVLQKGMTYRVSHTMLDHIHQQRKQEDQTEYQNWEVIEPETMEVRPMRFAGETVQHDIQNFRQQIETRRNQITEELQKLTK